MPFGAHETMEAHEILNEKLNLINHFSLYLQHCTNSNLRSMIEQHRQAAVQSYDKLIAYTHDYNAARGRQPYAMPQVNPEQIQYGLRNPMPQAPQMQGESLNDGQIAAAVLCAHKNSAKNHMWASLECADPHVRQMLLEGAVNCANQAYEVFLFMNQEGMYQVPTLQDHTAKTFLHAYQPAGAGQAMNAGEDNMMMRAPGMAAGGADYMGQQGMQGMQGMQGGMMPNPSSPRAQNQYVSPTQELMHQHMHSHMEHNRQQAPVQQYSQLQQGMQHPFGGYTRNEQTGQAYQSGRSHAATYNQTGQSGQSMQNSQHQSGMQTSGQRHTEGSRQDFTPVYNSPYQQ